MSGIINSVGSKSGVIGSTEISGGYEEGTFTLANTSQTPSEQSFFYTKIGRVVLCNGYMVTGAGGTSDTLWSGLPYSCKNDNGARAGGITNYNNDSSFSAMELGIILLGNSSTFHFRYPASTAAITSSSTIYLTITYIT
tara:strand:+ start:1166 stop:1582 length:417 start_codon:yes stop_codon:yes gene_type:complete